LVKETGIKGLRAQAGRTDTPASDKRPSRLAGQTLPGDRHDDVTAAALIPGPYCETLRQKRIK
jgi:hypothetical protein